MDADFIHSSEEKVLWQDKPLYRPFIMPVVLELLDSLKFLAFATLVVVIIGKVGGHQPDRGFLYLFALPVLGFHFIKLVRRHLDAKETTYYLTNHRVVIHNKNATITTKSLDRSWIRALDVSISQSEQKYGVGTILIDIGEVDRDKEGQKQPVLYKLEAIREPENVYRMF